MTLLLPSVAMSAARDVIHHTDLLTLCGTLGAASVDMILCDLPYGTTACSWDTVIPFEPMWQQFKRVIKPNRAIVLTASQPFTSKLTCSNFPMFRYEWIWIKRHGSNFLDVNRKPMKCHESALVFSSGACIYYPQMREGTPYRCVTGSNTANYGKFKRVESNNDGERYPLSVLQLNDEHGLHPTQKPVALFEYLIRTYTQPGDVVLDPCVGSGTTAVACRNLDRRYICGDSSAEYVAVARKRLQDTDPYQSTVLPTGDVQLSLFDSLAP